MASTYSALKIQLMTTGENSGTWGTVTNTNLGTALEEAIVGSADVTFASADVTLTFTDTNATQTARNLRLNLTGTVAAPQNLIVPAIEKVYIINNGLTQTITVKNSTGTGIAVPAGKTMWVYNNATNVVDVTTYLTSLALGSALPTASGGTGLVSFTAANNAIYSSSSSALTAGTLPITAGGTGSTTATFSGANITSLNASNISAGTLATAQGGTALTGFTAANNAIYSTSSSALTAGTLPITAGGTGSTTATFSGANITSLNANNVSAGILAAARGGTGNGFFLVSGPATSEKTYTFPNANMSVGYINIPAVADKTAAYTLATADIGKVVGVGTGGSIEIPNSTFAAGDAVLIFNNTSAGITITCTITTAYIAGTDADKATVTLATRGVANILFISSTACVITGNVS